MPISIGFHRHRRHRTIGCTIGLAPGVYVGAYGEDKADALHQAASYAGALQQKIDENPELKSVLAMSPYGAAALFAIQAASAIMKDGDDDGKSKAAKKAEVKEKVGPKTASLVDSLLSAFGGKK